MRFRLIRVNFRLQFARESYEADTRFPITSIIPCHRTLAGTEIVPAPPAENDILTVAEVAEILKCKKSSIYNLTRHRGQARYDNPIPVLRLPMGLRFHRSSVLATRCCLVSRSSGLAVRFARLLWAAFVGHLPSIRAMMRSAIEIASAMVDSKNGEVRPSQLPRVTALEMTLRLDIPEGASGALLQGTWRSEFLTVGFQKPNPQNHSCMSPIRLLGCCSSFC